MSATGIHNRIITVIAREILGPRRFQQRGRSRLWFLDLGWWLIPVEFQPSAWDRGTYLNVAAMWLWYPKDYFHYDYGPAGRDSRMGQFATFETEGQFTKEMRRIARSAAQAAEHLQNELSSITQVATRLATRAQLGGWDLYHAAAASTLAGRHDAAARYFRALASSASDDPDRDPDWLSELRRRAGQLAEAVDRRTAIVTITRDIQETRRLLKLPHWGGDFKRIHATSKTRIQ